MSHLVGMSTPLAQVGGSITAIVSPVGLVVLLAVAFGLTGRRLVKLWGMMVAAKREDNRFDRWGARVGTTLYYALGQARMVRWPYTGVLHVLIYWGFLVLITAVAQGMVEAAWLGFHMDDVPLGGVIALFQDLFYVLVVTGCVLALINRLLVRPTRFRGSHTGDAVLILVWIAALVTCMELDYATRIALDPGAPEALAHWRPVASAFSRMFDGLGPTSTGLQVIHGVFFWAHLSLILGFLVYLGYSKHLHVITSTPNVFFRNLDPKGALPTPNFEAEDLDHFGASKLEHFSWKDMLDMYTCTECGRCQAHCPAYNTGKPLSPKTLITDLRDHAYEAAAGGYAHTAHTLHRSAAGLPPDIPGKGQDHSTVTPEEHAASEATAADAATADAAASIASAGNGHRNGHAQLKGAFQPSWLTPEQVAEAVAAAGGEDRPLIGGTILEETLWSCTTCGACMDECPVLIEHVPKIIDMRRSLVLEEGRMPKQAESALRSIENVANPYGISQQTRADWARDLDVPLIKDHPDAEYLYWVGCATAFDDRAKTIAASLVAILKAAGVSFAILGTEEKCTGDPARRIGNEYLFQERAKENVELLGSYSVKKVIASCPHCFNTFANEYGAFGGTYEVVHHTQLIDRLLAEGRLRLETEVDATLTYHDSCYLGRWNDVFAPPRDILERIPGLRVVEMARNRNEGMCCGAGGGRMWMEEGQPRVNHRRVQQAVDTGAAKVATACPFCLSMFEEGIGSQNLGDSLAVDDVAVWVARALAPAPGEPALAAAAGVPAPTGFEERQPEPGSAQDAGQAGPAPGA